MSGHFIQPQAHDLLWISDAADLTFAGALPAWASAAWLMRAPVVVRRERAMNRVAVGLRGHIRSQRCAAYLAHTGILRRLQPEMLVRENDDMQAWAAFPVVAALRACTALLDDSDLRWGPTGSLGFSLASGINMLRAESDLDILVRAHQPLNMTQIRHLRAALASDLCRIDIQIDTGQGGFAFAEYLQGNPRLMLKTDVGPVLVSDPWEWQA
jgi:phosphoribosyl-dephospho-CoA transferase